MNEFLKEFLIAIGGGATALIALLTIFKSMFLKVFDKAIDTTFDKNIEKYKNKLTRSTTAYEILLKKEFDYYASLDPHLAALVPLVQDLVYYSDLSKEMDIEYRQKRYKENLLLFLEIIPKMKNDCVLYQPYIPTEVYREVSFLLGEMPRNLDFWSNAGNAIFDESDEPIDLEKANEISDSILLHIAKIEVTIKARLTQLSEQ